MPYTKIQLIAGVYKDDTPLAAEGFFIDADKIRFVRGKAQTIGGWEVATEALVFGVCRGLHAWRDNAGLSLAALGTHTHLQAYFDGELYDISPVLSRGRLTDPFSTVASSADVSVTDAGHGRAKGDRVRFVNATAVGGITIEGEYIVAEVSDSDTYSVTHSSPASSTAGPGGGVVDYDYMLPAGLADGTGGAGYGTGAYSVGGYGLPSSTVYYPRTWSLDNWGQNLLACPRGGGLYEWAPIFSEAELITNGGFDTDSDWTKGSGWSIAAGVATKSVAAASGLEQEITLSPSAYFLIEFDYTRSAGSLQPKIGATNIGAALSDASGHVQEVIFSASGTLKFHGDASFAGSVDNVMVTQLLSAQQVPGAPLENTSMIVTPERIVMIGGTVEAGSDTFNQLHVRWSDQENNQLWTASASNQAGFFTLAKGARIVSMRNSRGEILIWTDEGLYAARYVPDPNVVYSFTYLGSGCGLIGPNAAVVVNGTAYWMSNVGGFCRYAGGAPEVLPSTVQRDVFAHLSRVQHDKIYAFSISAHNEVWWLYPDSRDGNECSRYISYNYIDNAWSTGTFDRTAWIDAGALSHPLAASSDGSLYFHEKGNSNDGSSLSWSATSAAIDIGDGDRLMRIMGCIPDFEDLVGGVTLSVDTYRYPNTTAQTHGPYSISNSTDKVDIRAVGRQATIRLSGSSAPAFVRFGALRLDIRPTGMTR